MTRLHKSIWRGAAVATVAALGTASASADILTRVDRNSRKSMEILQPAPAKKMLMTTEGSGTPQAEPQPTLEFTVGVAHQRAESGDTLTSIPVSVDYTTADQLWGFGLASDGVARARSGGTSVTGFSDVSVQVSRTFKLDKLVLVTAFEVTWPSKGQLGSARASQAATLLASRGITDKWVGSVVAVVVHSNESTPGISQYTNLGAAKLKYKQDDDHAFIGTLRRGHTRGAGGATSVAFEYDFPLMGRAAALSVSRGLTSGKRGTSVGLDVTF